MTPAELAAASLTFSVQVRCFGHVEERALGKHEMDEPVTLENREEYVKLHLEWLLKDSVEAQFGVSGFCSTLFQSLNPILI